MANNSTNLSAQYMVSSQLIFYIVSTLLDTSNSYKDFNKFKQTNMSKISYALTKFIE